MQVRNQPEALVDELKIRARVRLNAARREAAATDAVAGGRLRDELHRASREIGFTGWEHARRVLGGVAERGEDMGSFWYAPRTGMLLHLWFSTHAEAREQLARAPRGFLLPYRRQCFIVQAPFIAELGLDAQDPAWAEVGHDLVAGYGSGAWRVLAGRRLRAPAVAFEAR